MGNPSTMLLLFTSKIITVLAESVLINGGY